ncbi:unnamed protein product [Closterium sp. NIES-53]
MEVARTSMIHAAAPHFLWPFAVQYTAHQLNLWPRVSLPETSPTMRWTGKVGDALVFLVWGSRAFVRDTFADNISSRAIPFGSLLPSLPYYTAPLPPLPLFLAPSPPPVDPLPPRGPAPSGVSQVDPLPGNVPVEVAVDSRAARGAASWGGASGGAESANAEPGGAEPEGAEPGGAESEGAESWGAEPRGTTLLERTRLRSGTAGAGGSAAGGTGAGGTGATRLGGARTRGTEADGVGGVGGAGAGDLEARDPGAGGTGANGAGAGGIGARDLGAGGVGTGGAAASGPGAGGTVQRRPFFVPPPPTSLPPPDSVLCQVLSLLSLIGLIPPLMCPPPDQSQPQLQPDSPLLAPSPYAKKTDSPSERHDTSSHPASSLRAIRNGPHVPGSRPTPVPGTHVMALRPSSLPLRVPLPSLPVSSLLGVPDPESDLALAASPTIPRLLATVVTDPSFESTAMPALVAELVEFAAACRIYYAARLVAGSDAFKRYKLLKLAMGEEKMPEEGDARDRWIEKSAVLYDLILQSVNNDMFQHIKDLVEMDDSRPKAWKLLQDQWWAHRGRLQEDVLDDGIGESTGDQDVIEGKANPGMFLMVEDVKGSEGDVGSVGKVVMHPLTHWVIDSGCTSHMTPRADLLDEVKPLGKIKFVAAASGALLPVIGVGNAKVMGAIGGLVGLGNVLLVEGLSANLLSVRRLQKSKAKVTSGPTSCRAKLGKLLLWDLEEKSSCIKDLWQLPIIPWNGKPPATAAAAATVKTTAGGEETAPTDGALDAVKKVQQTQQPHGEVLAGVDATAAWAKASSGNGDADWETWHERLCHINIPMLQKLVKDGSLKGLEVKGAAKEIGSCPTCLETKFTKFPFSSGTGPAKALPALVHMDVVGPTRAPSLSGSRYFLTIMDDHTRAVWVYPLKTKGQVAAAVLKEWMPRAQRESRHKVKVIRIDNGGEFIGADIESVLKKKGIQHQLTVPYNPQQNGVAERFNRTLHEGARTLLGRAGLPDPFWVTALRQVALVKNRVLATVGDKQWVPYTKWYGSAPAVNMLRAYGCMVVFHVPKEKRGKLEASGRWGVHLGLAKDHKGWLIWDLTSQQLTVSRDVKFLESLYYKEWKQQQQQKLPTTPLIIEADEVQRPSRQVQVEEQQQQDAPQGAARAADCPRRDVCPPNRLTYLSFGKPKVVRAAQEGHLSLAEKYGLQDGGKPATPSPSGFTVEPCVDEEVMGESDRKLFHSMVGALNYAANHTRPDIAFATSRLASVVSRLSHEQLEAAKRLVRYVSATASVGLEYCTVRQRLQRGAADLGKGETLLTCYIDASFNSVKADGTSIGGYVCLFGGGAVSWRSKKQNEVGQSSCETEYMALHHGAKEVVWLRRLLEEIGVCQKEPTVILCDNESAVKLAKNACLHGLTKHIKPRWHWVRRLLDKEAPQEWHDTLRTSLAALGFAPSTADSSLLRTDASLPLFYVVVYVDNLVFATANTEALALVKSELQKRHTCTDLGPSVLRLLVILATVHSSA